MAESIETADSAAIKAATSMAAARRRTLRRQLVFPHAAAIAVLPAVRA